MTKQFEHLSCFASFAQCKDELIFISSSYSVAPEKGACSRITQNDSCKNTYWWPLWVKKVEDSKRTENLTWKCVL